MYATGRYRDDLLDQLTVILEADSRVRAVWLSGSFGRGTEDDWSDLDLHVAVEDAQFETWLTERPGLYRRIGDPVLIRPDKPSNTGPGPFQEVIFAGPVTLDFNVYPASLARPGLDCRVLFDRLPLPAWGSVSLDPTDRANRIGDTIGFFWAMTAIALKYVARGNTHRAITQLDLLLGAYVSTWRLIHAPDRLDAGGAHWLHPVHDAALRDTIPVLGECIDSLAVMAAIETLMRAMEPLHSDSALLGAAVPDAVAREIAQFRDAIAAHLDGAADTR